MEPVGQHANYGFALAAQPRGAQGRTTTNMGSQLNVYERPPPSKPEGTSPRMKPPLSCCG